MNDALLVVSDGTGVGSLVIMYARLLPVLVGTPKQRNDYIRIVVNYGQSRGQGVLGRAQGLD